MIRKEHQKFEDTIDSPNAVAAKNDLLNEENVSNDQETLKLSGSRENSFSNNSENKLQILKDKTKSRPVNRRKKSSKKFVR